MHPAVSVILFTCLSGIGYGLLFFAGLFAAFGLLPADPWFGGSVMGLALALVGAGLLSSTFHLGHPERAWRAVTQWRSSWLSREGVLALLSFVPALIFGGMWVLGGTVSAWVGVAMAALAVATVYATGMIYASLKTVHQWNCGHVPTLYLSLGAGTGILWMIVLARLFGAFNDFMISSVFTFLALALAVKISYWQRADSSRSPATVESATGLGDLGPVRRFELPHSSENYLMQEMGYQIARKHAAKLRRWTMILLFGVPLALVLGQLLFEGATMLNLALALVAALSATAGVLLERWLFFAEARHAVTLYYGAEHA